MTPADFDRELNRLIAQAWDQGLSAGLTWASAAIAGTPAPPTVNPYLERAHEAGKEVPLHPGL